MVSRRTFLKYTAGSTLLTLFGYDKFAGISKALARSRRILRSDLDPEVRDTAACAAGDAEGGHHRPKGRQECDYYEISMKQISQQILPAGMPATAVWVWAVKSANKNGLLVHNARR